MKRLLPLLVFVCACGTEPAAPGSGGDPDAGEKIPAIDEPYNATATAPEAFKVRFETTKGDVLIECKREWAPNGVDRLYNLVRMGYYTDIAIFRVVAGFVVQFGIHGDPNVSSVWRNATIEPDPVKTPNERGMITFAMRGSPDTRTTQLFINLKNNSANLDSKGFAPVARVIEGMEVVDSFYKGYAPPPPQQNINAWGNRYLQQEFPKLDYVKQATLILE